MKILTVLLSLAMFSAVVHAAPESSGDPKSGKALYEKDCVSCHASMFGGDGSKIYTRADRKVKTKQQLAAQVSACNANIGVGWFPEDEAHVAAYLNQQYYKFK